MAPAAAGGEGGAWDSRVANGRRERHEPLAHLLDEVFQADAHALELKILAKWLAV